MDRSRQQIRSRRYLQLLGWVGATAWVASLAAAARRLPGGVVDEGTSAPILLAFLWLAGGLLLAQLGLIFWLVRRRRQNESADPPQSSLFQPPQGDDSTFSALVGDSHELMQETDSEGRVRFSNRAWREALGYRGPESRELFLRQIVDPDALAAYQEVLDSLSKEAPARRVQTVLRTRQGESFEVEGTLRAHSTGSQEVSTLGVFRDARGAQEVAAQKRDFITTMGHELRTPLTSLVGALDLLPNYPEEESAEVGAGELLEISRRNSERLLYLVNDLLDLQKLETGSFALRPEPCRAEEALQETLETLGGFLRSEDVTVVTKLDGEAWVQADPKRLQQVLRNLLASAVRMSPEGSEITLEINPRGDSVAFSLTDQGPGLPEEAYSASNGSAEAVDSSTSFAGFGVGIDIASRLVIAMGGRLLLSRPSAGGNRVTFELPKGSGN